MCAHVSALSQSAVWRRVIRDAEHVKKWPTEIVLLFVSEKKTKLLSIKIQVSKVIWQEVHVRDNCQARVPQKVSLLVGDLDLV